MKLNLSAKLASATSAAAVEDWELPRMQLQQREVSDSSSGRARRKAGPTSCPSAFIGLIMFSLKLTIGSGEDALLAFESAEPSPPSTSAIESLASSSKLGKAPTP